MVSLSRYTTVHVPAVLLYRVLMKRKQSTQHTNTQEGEPQEKMETEHQQRARMLTFLFRAQKNTQDVHKTHNTQVFGLEAKNKHLQAKKINNTNTSAGVYNTGYGSQYRPNTLPPTTLEYTIFNQGLLGEERGNPRTACMKWVRQGFPPAL